MNKLSSRDPVLRFKLGNRIEKFLNPSRGITINKSNVSRFGPTATKILLGWKNSLFPQTSDNRASGGGGSTSYTGGGGGGSRGGSNSTSKPITYRTQDGTVITYSNGRWTDSSGNPYTFISTKTTTVNPKTNSAARKPAVTTKPTVVANRAATGYTLPEGVTSVADTQTMLKNAGFNLGKYGVDGVWGKDTLAAYDAWKNKLAANVGGTTGTTPNVTYTPTDTGVKVAGNNYNFILPTNTNTNTSIYESYYPGTYSNLNNMFTRKGIRSNRGTNYSNVNEYWDWLLNNKDSEDYKVWSNIMGNDGYLNKEIFDNVMSQYGIRGNLGRRDSGRLARILNDLNLVGVKGSDARKAFLTNFNRNLPSSEEINEYVRANTPTPARPNLSTINWGSTPRIISNNNLFNINKSEYPLLFAKKGGLISRNPIKRFKLNK